MTNPKTLARLTGYLIVEQKSLHSTECPVLLEFAQEIARATIEALFEGGLDTEKDKEVLRWRAKEWLGGKT